MGQLIGELVARGMSWHEERNFLMFQSLLTKYYKMLKRLRLQDCEDAYLWIVYKAKIPDAGLSIPEPGKEHHFPKFMYDKLGTKPMKRIVAMYSPEGLPTTMPHTASFLGLQKLGPLGSIIHHQSTLCIPIPLMRILSLTVR